LVGYPILSLDTLQRPPVNCFVSDLESVLISTCSQLGLSARTNAPETGVWAGPRKVGALGVHVARRRTAHGFALNCDLDMKWFDGVVACGLTSTQHTSITKELGVTIGVDQVVPLVIEEFQKRFQCELRVGGDEELDQLVNKYLR
jgi:lipoate-protein ligase B